MDIMGIPSLSLALSGVAKSTIANGFLLLVIGVAVILALSVFTMLPRSSVVLLPHQQQSAYGQFSTSMTTTPNSTTTTPPMTTPPISEQPSQLLPPQGEIFESEKGGFRLQVPEGWVIQDTTETEGYDEALESSSIASAAILCKETEALPGLGGTYDCFNAQRTVTAVVAIIPELQSRPELENNNKTITTSDLVALIINATQQEFGGHDFVIRNNTDIDNSTKIVDLEYKTIDQAGTATPFDDSVIPSASSVMFVLSPDKNIGYSISGPSRYYYSDNPGGGTSRTRSEDAAAMEQMFNSFELVE